MKYALLLILTVSIGVAGIGCTQFPYGMSLDKHNYVSTPSQPLTLTLVDTFTDKVVWTLDIPVNMQAVIDFDHSAKWTAAQTSHMPATKIKWTIMDPDSRAGLLSNSQKLNGNPVLLKVSIRDTAEVAASPTSG